MKIKSYLILIILIYFNFLKSNEKFEEFTQAIMSNDINNVNRLITFIDINSTDCFGTSPLMLAVIENNQNIVDLILAQDKIDINYQDSLGCSALITAVTNRSSIQLISKLLSHKNININLKNYVGSSALILSIDKDPEYVKLLLDKSNFDINHIIDTYFFAKKELINVFKNFSSESIDENDFKNFMEPRKKNIEESIILLRKKIHKYIKNLILELYKKELSYSVLKNKIIKILPIKYEDKNKNNILHHVFKSGNRELAGLILSVLPKLAIKRNKFNETPLSYMFSNKQLVDSIFTLVK